MKFVKVSDTNPKIHENYRKHNCWFWLVSNLEDLKVWGGDWPFFATTSMYKRFVEDYATKDNPLLIRQSGTWTTLSGFEIYEETEGIFFPDSKPNEILLEERIEAFSKKWGYDVEKLDAILMENYFWNEKLKLWFPKESWKYSKEEQLLADFLKNNH